MCSLCGCNQDYLSSLVILYEVKGMVYVETVSTCLSVFLWPGLIYLNSLLDFCEIQYRSALQIQAWVPWEPAEWQSYFSSSHTFIFPLFLTNFGDMQQVDLHIMLLSSLMFCKNWCRMKAIL